MPKCKQHLKYLINFSCYNYQVHDSATFLQKELRAIALHIVIRHVSTNSSSINSLYNTRPIGNSKHSSILKTMVGSLLSNPSSNTSGQNSLQKSSIVSGSLSELNVNSHNNTNSQFTDDTTSFSLKNKTLSLESFEDGLSLSGMYLYSSKHGKRYLTYS